MLSTLHSRKLYVFVTAFLLFSVKTAVPVFAAGSAVVLMYHRFGESRYPSTNTTVNQFMAHISELKNKNYVVKPIPEIIAALRRGKSLPPRTIGISIDDAFLSVYKIAGPILNKANFPYTLFVATEPLDRSAPGYMSWDQLRELIKGGANIGSQTATHLHMPETSAKKNLAELEKSNARFKRELGTIPKMIAYPYGEYSLAVEKVSITAGFTTGFGQHSGVVYKNSNFMYLPRFTFNESYGDMKRLRIAIRALPLKVRDITPADPYLDGTLNPPTFGFSVEENSIKSISQLACYATGQGRIRIEILGERRVEVRALKAFPPGRTRVNCTLPAHDGRWHWLGTQFLVPYSSN